MRHFTVFAACLVLGLNLAGCAKVPNGAQEYSYTAPSDETDSGVVDGAGQEEQKIAGREEFGSGEASQEAAAGEAGREKPEDEIVGQLGDGENTFTEEDENASVLETTLNQAARVKVSIRIDVSNMRWGEMIFKGFTLAYVTEDDGEIEVLRHETDEYASGGYKWKDSFSREVDLPAGKNKLIFTANGGKNYKVALNIKVTEAE